MKIEILGYWITIKKKPIRNEEGKFVSPDAIANQRTTEQLKRELSGRVICNYRDLQEASKMEEFGR